jgi:NAD(P)-dependent dehydrogenase (short-subunit alcohol dehydrogenase family)
MKPLNGKIALVTGGSGRVGGGVAQGLGEAGATVYLTARTLFSLEEAVKEVEAVGGIAFPIQCDHKNDREVKKVFEHIKEKQGRLDVLVNSVWGGYMHLRKEGKDAMTCAKGDPNFVESYKWDDPFWKQPIELWDSMFDVGVRSTYVSSLFAAPIMVAQKEGLIVNLTIIAASTAKNTAYAASHVVIGHLTSSLASQLKAHNVVVVSVYPGAVFPKEKNVPNSESPLFVGRSIAALAADPQIVEKSGNSFGTGKIAEEYRFTDIDGSKGTQW